MLESSTKDLQIQAAGSLRDLMAVIPAVRLEGVEVEPSLPDRRIDMLAQLIVYNRPHLLICEIKSSGQARNAREALCVVFRSTVVSAVRTPPLAALC